MEKKTLYLVMIGSKPAIDMLFDTYDEAKKYTKSIDKRKTKAKAPYIRSLIYYDRGRQC